jgi:hypothetical protein
VSHFRHIQTARREESANDNISKRRQSSNTVIRRHFNGEMHFSSLLQISSIKAGVQLK